MNFIIAALIVLLVAIAAGRWHVRRSLTLLSIEEKARILDASCRDDVWPLGAVAVVVAIMAYLPPSLFIPISFLPGYIAAFFISLFLIALGATLIRLSRISHLGAPPAYKRAFKVHAFLYLVALLLFICVVITVNTAGLYRRLHPVQSHNQTRGRVISQVS